MISFIKTMFARQLKNMKIKVVFMRVQNTKYKYVGTYTA